MSPDELQRIHQRIAEVEHALVAGHPRPPQRLLANLTKAAGLAMLVALGSALTTRACEPSSSTIVEASPPPPPPAPAPGSLRILDGLGPSFAPSLRRPADLIMRAWSREHPAAPLWVVAFDRRTYEVRWRAGPWPSEAYERGQMLVAGDDVVVTDADAMVHILDAQSGVERRSLRLPAKPVAIDPIPGHPDRVQMQLHRDEVHDRRRHDVVVFLSEGVYATADAPPDRHACRPDGATPCTSAIDEPGPELTRLFSTRIYSASELQGGSDRFVLVSATAGVGPGQTEYVVRYDPIAKKPLWKLALVPSSRRWEPYPNTAEPGLTVLAEGRIVHVYPLHDGGHRIITRTAEGGLLYDEPLPGLDYGTKISSVTAEGADVFIIASGRLIVIDARTGAVTRRIGAF